MDKPVVLTAKLAKMIEATSCCNCAAQLSDSLADHEVEAINAVADGRTVVVPRMSEGEAKAAFDKHYEEQAFLGLAYRRLTLDCWLAALRYAGILLPTGEKGT